MGYSKKNLIGDEKIIYSASLSLWPMCGQLFGGLVAFSAIFYFDVPLIVKLGLFGVGALLWSWVYVALETTELTITDRRIIIKHGLIRRATDELYLNRIEGIEVKQTLIGRVCDFGTLQIRGVGTEVAPVNDIAGPIEFRNRFFKAADKATVGDSGGMPSPTDKVISAPKEQSLQTQSRPSRFKKG